MVPQILLPLLWLWRGFGRGEKASDLELRKVGEVGFYPIYRNIFKMLTFRILLFSIFFLGSKKRFISGFNFNFLSKWNFRFPSFVIFLRLSQFIFSLFLIFLNLSFLVSCQVMNPEPSQQCANVISIAPRLRGFKKNCITNLIYWTSGLNVIILLPVRILIKVVQWNGTGKL